MKKVPCTAVRSATHSPFPSVFWWDARCRNRLKYQRGTEGHVVIETWAALVVVNGLILLRYIPRQYGKTG